MGGKRHIEHGIQLLITYSAPPPTQSHPEAANFPTKNYEFNADPTPFKAPQSYPEPPKDMWYEVPKEKPLPREAKPKPIFPWEERHSIRPTRFFAEDVAPPPITTRTAEEDFGGRGQTPTTDNEALTPTTPVITLNDDKPPTMDPVPRNAWDDVAGIDNYIRHLNQWQRLRGKLQVLSTDNPYPQAQSPADEDTANPLASPISPTTTTKPHPATKERRESLILTDFPSAIERPSLPVTPAPIRRNMFWGEERDASGQLPAAEGVPDQAEWVCPHCGFSSSVNDLVSHFESEG